MENARSKHSDTETNGAAISPSFNFENCVSKFTGFDTLRSDEVFVETLYALFQKETLEYSSHKSLSGDSRNFLTKYFRYKNKLVEMKKLEADDVLSFRNEFFSDSDPITKTLVVPTSDLDSTSLIEKLKRDGSYMLSGDLIFQSQKVARLLFDIPPHPENRTISEKQCKPPYIVCKIESFSGLMLAQFEVMLASRCSRIQTCEVCGSHFFAGRAEAKYCYWRCPKNPPDSRASCKKQVHDNKKLLQNRELKLGKKIHSNHVSFDNKYSIALEKRDIPEKDRKALKQEAWVAMETYRKELEKWKNDFLLCNVTKDEFFDWLCSMVPQKKQN